MQSRNSPLLAFAILATMVASTVHAEQVQPQGFQPVRENADSPFVLATDRRPSAEIVVPPESELVANAAEWLRDYVRQAAGGELPIRHVEKLNPQARCIVAAVGEQDGVIKSLVAAGRFRPEPLVGPQGFVIQRVSTADGSELVVCWSPSDLGCRYGLIEILRSLRVDGGKVQTNLGHVVDRPQFPYRICYVNFAEHLQNAYNPNVLFDAPVNRWTARDWERFIDMISAFRYNVFEFWLVPTLFSPEALRGGKIQTEFAETMNHVVAYAKRRGVRVHPIVIVNCVGANWHYHCPKDPKEHDEIIALWDHWSRALKGIDHIGFFPGDPGGCTRNGCTAETCVDLYLELSKVVRKNNPTVTIELGTWGEPFAGWGVPLWTGKTDRAERAMNYFLSKLPEFPAGTLTSINMGFSPDCLPSHGGDGRPYAKRTAATNPVLTWDYSVSEGEGTVLPHGRVRRMLSRRREELAEGCYSGGICYTMSPRLNCLSLFCCGEAYWNPGAEPDALLAEYGRLIFGDELAAIGPLLEEFEVVPDWGYYPPFPYSPQRLEKSMARLASLLRKIDAKAESRLPLAPTMAEYRKSLLFFAELLQKLGSVAAALEQGTGLLKEAGRVPRDRKAVVTLAEMDGICAGPADFPEKDRVRQIAAMVRRLDVGSLRKEYWSTVYGIYDAVPHPADPRAEGATNTLFQFFHGEAAIAHNPPKP